MDETDDDISIHTYTHIRPEKIAGFLVADTDFTQRELYEVLAEVLHEASFFGYDQEHPEESVKEEEEGDERRYAYDTAELYELLRLPPEEHDERSDELMGRVREAEWEFEQYWRRKELNALRKRQAEKKAKKLSALESLTGIIKLE